jgi:ribosomal protein L22
MTPADDKKDEAVEETVEAVESSEAEATTEVVDETTLEEEVVEPAEETEEAPAEDIPGEVAEEPVAEAAEEAPAKPRRSRAKKADAPPAEQARPARKSAPLNGDRPVVRAHAKYVRTSARKARLVCDHIRGKSVSEARAILAHTPRAVAEDWQKLLESAVANAEHNHELLGDDLRILSVTADEGPTLKRFQPRAMGRASRIRKRTSHLSIALTPKEQ